MIESVHYHIQYCRANAEAAFFTARSIEQTTEWIKQAVALGWVVVEVILIRSQTIDVTKRFVNNE